MQHAIIKTAVTGLSQQEALDGLPVINKEFQNRKWILNPDTKWDEAKSLLIISVEYETKDLIGAEKAAKDEIRDCVIACFNISGNIQFECIESKLL
jgi:hypothetical protein